ncbi:hypothetical protein N9L68_00875 [bacterium]|nr:hypothetical protein [bacterium]
MRTEHSPLSTTRCAPGAESTPVSHLEDAAASQHPEIYPLPPRHASLYEERSRSQSPDDHYSSHESAESRSPCTTVASTSSPAAMLQSPTSDLAHACQASHYAIALDNNNLGAEATALGTSLQLQVMPRDPSQPQGALGFVGPPSSHHGEGQAPTLVAAGLVAVDRGLTSSAIVATALGEVGPRLAPAIQPNTESELS